MGALENPVKKLAPGDCSIMSAPMARLRSASSFTIPLTNPTVLMIISTSTATAISLSVVRVLRIARFVSTMRTVHDVVGLVLDRLMLQHSPVAGADRSHHQGVKKMLRPDVLHLLGRWVFHLIGAHHHLVLGREMDLEILAVRDHIEDAGA